MKLYFLYDSQLCPKSLIRSFKDNILSTVPAKSCKWLLRWGNIAGDDTFSSIVLNRKQPLKNCLDKEMVFKILRTHRIRRPKIVIPKPEGSYPLICKFFDFTSNTKVKRTVNSFEEALSSGADFFVEPVDTIKKYNIYIFNQHVFYMTKKIAVKTNTERKTVTSWEYEEIPNDIDNDTHKACLLALRALHSLGLDFGLVHSATDSDNRPVILDVSPVPNLNSKVAELFKNKVNKFLDKLVQQEFALSNSPNEQQNHQVQTTLFNDKKNLSYEPLADILLGTDPEFMLRDSHSGKIVYPSEFLNRTGSLGYDERSENREGRLYPLAEVRPGPDHCPIRLTGKIRRILEKALSVIPDHIEWLAGSVHFDKYQIGGHIHFSNIEMDSRLLRALDNYLAIPLVLIEDSRTSIRRRRHYGFLGSIRSKPHGGFEYRTPGSWLVSPQITCACLCLAKIVAANYPMLSKDFLVNPDLQQAFYQGKKHYFYDVFNEIWQDIKRTPLFNEYSTYLTSITELIHTRNCWDENTDLRKSWGFLPS